MVATTGIGKSLGEDALEKKKKNLSIWKSNFVVVKQFYFRSKTKGIPDFLFMLTSAR